MGYECIVCIKQVPDTGNIHGDVMNEDGTVNRAALPTIFNPEDLNALEAALNENRLLLLEVTDNGKGLSTEIRAGVGFTSVRERAVELGGECIIENIPTGGARIRAKLPISSIVPKV